MPYDLYTKCKNCGHRILIKNVGGTRMDAETALSEIHGQHIAHKTIKSPISPWLIGHCGDHCLRTYLYSPYEVYAGLDHEPEYEKLV
jgi:DNA-directed RNA polymerase subunit RPC12/RpoP